MKGLDESSPFHLLTNPHVINRFIFGHGVVIYYLIPSIQVKDSDSQDHFLIKIILIIIIHIQAFSGRFYNFWNVKE